jgi:hypothetical protein
MEERENIKNYLKSDRAQKFEGNSLF